MNLPTLPVLTAGVLALACVFALARVWRQRAQRSRLALVTLLALQPALATALYFGLFPPLHMAQTGSSLVVLTAGWRSAAAANLSGQRIALPEAEPAASAERAPDLATALRRHPQITLLHILGHG
ncbi:MAG TPA: carboxypeptidase regulatory-like domain-containing protein, partial [Thermomonas sp.]|nr:carboxypeptidase regulatory-like domain-containing protein [Thermomonas sp.]